MDLPQTDDKPVKAALRMFWSQTHGALITEWHSFLNGVFEELANHSLKKDGNSDIVTKGLVISLYGGDFSSYVKLRDSIRDALFQKFSSENHPERLRKLRKILKINKTGLENHAPVRLQKIDELTKAIKKHVAVRNCLEHASNTVRSRDLTAAGYDNIIPMLNSHGVIHNYVEGDKISVSDKDVIELNDTIIKYMNYFEVEL